MRKSTILLTVLFSTLLAFTTIPASAQQKPGDCCPLVDPLLIAQDQATNNFAITHMTGTTAKALAKSLAPSNWNDAPYLSTHDVNIALDEVRRILFSGLGDWQLVIGPSADGTKVEIYRIPGNWPSPALCGGAANCTATPLKSVVVDSVLDSITLTAKSN